MNSNRIFGLPDSPSADNDATSKKYVDTKTYDMATNASVTTATANMATTSSVTTAITNALSVNSGTTTNNPSVTRNDTMSDAMYLTGMPIYPLPSNGFNTRGNLYISSQMYYSPVAKTLFASTFNGFFEGNATGIWTPSGAGARVYVNGGTVEAINIKSDGKIGIGTTNSSYPLEIGTGAWGTTSVNTKYLAYDSGSIAWTGTNGTLTSYISLKTAGSIWMNGSHIIFSSDQRIKKNIVQLNADKMMNILRNMRPVSFDFIDPMKNVNKKHFGFIAQEVNEVLPEGISLNTDVIPNNMMKGEIDQKSKIEASFTLKPDDADISLNYLLLTTDTSVKFDTANPYSSSNVYKFKIYCGEKWAKEQDIYIRSDYNVIDNKYTYIIGMKKDVYDIVITEPTLFVYGQYVYDLHTLEHDTIYTVATAALQEVDRQQQADKVRIADLEATVAEQKSLINDILERLKKVEKA